MARLLPNPGAMEAGTPLGLRISGRFDCGRMHGPASDRRSRRVRAEGAVDREASAGRQLAAGRRSVLAWAQTERSQVSVFELVPMSDPAPEHGPRQRNSIW